MEQRYRGGWLGGGMQTIPAVSLFGNVGGSCTGRKSHEVGEYLKGLSNLQRDRKRLHQSPPGQISLTLSGFPPFLRATECSRRSCSQSGLPPIFIPICPQMQAHTHANGAYFANTRLQLGFVQRSNYRAAAVQRGLDVKEEKGEPGTESNGKLAGLPRCASLSVLLKKVVSPWKQKLLASQPKDTGGRDWMHISWRAEQTDAKASFADKMEE